MKIFLAFILALIMIHLYKNLYKKYTAGNIGNGTVLPCSKESGNFSVTLGLVSCTPLLCKLINLHVDGILAVDPTLIIMDPFLSHVLMLHLWDTLIYDWT